MTAAWRSSRRWRAVCRLVLADPDETHCIRCRGWVDKDLPPGSPQSPTVDHIIAAEAGGARYDRDNAGLAHHGCNSRHGARLRWAKQRGQGVFATGMMISEDVDSL